jgi:NitT/TauT family transport system substrate-binding protein
MSQWSNKNEQRNTQGGNPMIDIAQSRRRFLATIAASGVGLIGGQKSIAQDGRLETTTVRIGKIAGICIAPQYVAEELLVLRALTISATCG